MKRLMAAAAGVWLVIGALGCDVQDGASSNGRPGAPAVSPPDGPGAPGLSRSPAAQKLASAAAGTVGPLRMAGRLPGGALFDGDSRSGADSFFGGDAVPVTRPSVYTGRYTPVKRVSDLSMPPPPPLAGGTDQENRLLRAVRAVGGNISVASTIFRSAVHKGLDPILAVAVGTQESGLKNGLRSRAGALGAMQVMPGTACAMGVCRNDRAVRYDAATNANLGTAYLQKMLDGQGGNVPLALAAYNAGPNAVHGRIPNNGETPNYVASVLAYYRKYRLAVTH